MNLAKKKILITGGTGFVGSHVVENLINLRKVAPKNIVISHSQDLDLRIFKNARKAVKGVDVIFHLAVDVGGLGYSSVHPAQQYYNCSLLDLQVLEAAKDEGVEKVVLVSSACAYAHDALVPLKEKDLFKGKPAPTHDGYGMAKRNTVFLADIYRRQYGLNTVVVLPNNMYGPGDNFDLQGGHVIPMLIRKCLTQKELIVWGDGRQTRDFLYVKDGADGIILAMEKLGTSGPVNLGTGEEKSIKELVDVIVKYTGFKGSIRYDTSKPVGQIKRSVNITRARKLLGYRPKWDLERGIIETVKWCKKNEMKSWGKSNEKEN